MYANLRIKWDKIGKNWLASDSEIIFTKDSFWPILIHRSKVCNRTLRLAIALKKGLKRNSLVVVQA